MGNICSSCLCGKVSCCMVSKSSKKGTEKGVIPSDLHSGGAHKQTGVVSGSYSLSSSTQRPVSLGISTSQTQNETNAALTKFSSFPLHGTQKTSPLTASTSATPIQTEKNSELISSFDPDLINIFFDEYRDDVEKDLILARGIERMCNDLDVDPTSFIVLALAWKFKAHTMCRFSRHEFQNGCHGLKCHNIRAMKSSLETLEKEVLVPKNFKELYRFTFQFSLDVELGQKSLPCEIAVAMWKIVFSCDEPALLQPWTNFLDVNQVRGISRDTWNMLLFFVKTIREDLTDYNDNEAWPSLFDDFVQFQRSLVDNVESDDDNTQGSTFSLLHVQPRTTLPESSEETGSDAEEELTSSSEKLYDIPPPGDGQGDVNVVTSSLHVPGMIMTSSMEASPVVLHGEGGEKVVKLPSNNDNDTVDVTVTQPVSGDQITSSYYLHATEQ